jgi:hypothetical protein
MAASKRGPKKVSQAHKDALALGRTESRTVSAYLEGLRAAKPGRRGPRRTPESIQARIDAIDATLGTVGALDELKLRQERRTLLVEFDELSSAGEDLGPLEDAFCDVAASYSERKGIEYSTWREMGVSAATLRRAGVARSRG